MEDALEKQINKCLDGIDKPVFDEQVAGAADELTAIIDKSIARSADHGSEIAKEAFLQERIRKIYDAARHRPCPKERQAAILYLRLAERWFTRQMRKIDGEVAAMYAKSLEAIQRKVEVV